MNENDRPASAGDLRPGLSSEVVVIGAGFGGLEVAKALGKAGIDTTVIDRHNHHLFQPILYHIATAALSATDVAEPARKFFGGSSPSKCYLARCQKSTRTCARSV